MPQVVSIGNRRYDVELLRKYAESIEVETIKLGRINYHVNSKIWRDKLGRFSVGEVLRNRYDPRFVDHFNRIRNAELRYPILLDKKFKILDGYHRYNHARLYNIDEIHVKILPDEILEQAEIINHI